MLLAKKRIFGWASVQRLENDQTLMQSLHTEYMLCVSRGGPSSSIYVQIRIFSRSLRNMHLKIVFVGLMSAGLVDHEFKVNRAQAVGAVVPDVLGPSLALDVDQHSGCKIKLKMIRQCTNINKTQKEKLKKSVYI